MGQPARRLVHHLLSHERSPLMKCRVWGEGGDTVPTSLQALLHFIQPGCLLGTQPHHPRPSHQEKFQLESPQCRRERGEGQKRSGRRGKRRKGAILCLASDGRVWTVLAKGHCSVHRHPSPPLRGTWPPLSIWPCLFLPFNFSFTFSALGLSSFQ